MSVVPAQCPCGYGRYKDAIGSTNCICVPGSIEEFKGGPCLSCAPGKYQVSETTCADCPEHSDTPFDGAISVFDCKCVGGRYMHQDNESRLFQCESCPEFSRSEAGSESIADCACLQGSYFWDVGICLSCPPNAFSSTLSTRIEDCYCNSGYFLQATTSEYECITCPPNSYSDTHSDTVFQCFCNLGFIGPPGGPCVACPSGTYQDQYGVANASCVPCPADTTSPYNASTKPTDCKCVQHYSGPDYGPCLPCEVGKFNYKGGSAPCSKCGVGALVQAGGVCRCMEGYSGPDDGVCIECAAGKFKDTLGSAPCLDCSANSERKRGDSKCACSAGYFRQDQFCMRSEVVCLQSVLVRLVLPSKLCSPAATSGKCWKSAVFGRLTATPGFLG